MIDGLRTWWAEFRARRLISMLEREQAYHRQLLYFHAEQAHRCHFALLRARRGLSQWCLTERHVPSIHLLDGSQR